MTDEELLRLQERSQSFATESSSGNAYNGKDNLFVGNIQDDRMYVLVHDGHLAELNNGKTIGAEYFFDQATYDKYVDQATGIFDAKALSEALQVGPWQSDSMKQTDGHAEYRISIACFERTGEIRTPVGTCEANNQFGGGGAHEAFIPESESRALQEKGILKYNKSASSIKTGINYVISREEYERINTKSIERCDNCANNNIPHPEPEACKGGFALNPSIGGTAFNATGISESDIREEAKDISVSYKEKEAEQVHSGHEPPSSSGFIDTDIRYATVVDVVASIVEESPPLLHDLTSLQIEASRRYGMTAAETLACIQHLYEEGDATYPRTGSNYISSDMENTVESLLSDIEDNS